MSYSDIAERSDPPATGLPAYLGIIEGFFGRSWDWAVRRDYARWLRDAGYAFYIYAPKDDKYLRREWQQDWPQSTWAALEDLAECCRSHGVQFGLGLSPFEAYRDYSAPVRARLIEKVRSLEQRLQPELLCLLFDDMRGDTPDLAVTQLKMIADVASHTRARVVMCPTYYSTDPILERVFGTMPADYLETLGQSLDPAIGVFWTGPKVCSSEYPLDHLAWVAERLRRKPFLWDNYPVNDSRKMSSFLHLRAFTHRPQILRDYLAGHAANPMKQPWLSRIPLATLAHSYDRGTHYDPHTAWRKAAVRTCGTELAEQLARDLPLLQDVGLEALTPEQQQHLRAQYASFATHPAAREILGWLNGEYVFDPACLTD